MRQTLMERLIIFWANDWELDAAYDAKFFCDLFGASTFGVRNALTKLNNLGYINIVRLDKNVYYIKHDWYNAFSHFNQMGRVIE